VPCQLKTFGTRPSCTETCALHQQLEVQDGAALHNHIPVWRSVAPVISPAGVMLLDVRDCLASKSPIILPSVSCNLVMICVVNWPSVTLIVVLTVTIIPRTLVLRNSMSCIIPIFNTVPARSFEVLLGIAILAARRSHLISWHGISPAGWLRMLSARWPQMLSAWGLRGLPAR